MAYKLNYICFARTNFVFVFVETTRGVMHMFRERIAIG